MMREVGVEEGGQHQQEYEGTTMMQMRMELMETLMGMMKELPSDREKEGKQQVDYEPLCWKRLEEEEVEEISLQRAMKSWKSIQWLILLMMMMLLMMREESGTSKTPQILLERGEDVAEEEPAMVVEKVILHERWDMSQEEEVGNYYYSYQINCS